MTLTKTRMMRGVTIVSTMLLASCWSHEPSRGKMHEMGDPLAPARSGGVGGPKA